MDWEKLKSRVDEDINSGDFMTQSYKVGDKEFSFRSYNDIIRFREWINGQANIQAGKPARVRRIKCVATRDRKFG